MTALSLASFFWFSLWAFQPPPDLDSVRAEPDMKRRVDRAVVYAGAQINAGRTAYAAGDVKGLAEAMEQVAAGVEVCDEALRAPGRNPARNLGQFKKAEIRLREIVRRLDQLATEINVEDRKPVETAKEKVQRVQNQLLVDITSRRKL